MQTTFSEKTFNYLNFILLGGIAILSLYPFWYILSLSFSSAATATQQSLHLWPKEICLASYRMVFSDPDMLTGYTNTIIRTVAGTFLTMLFTCLGAYPLSKPYLPYRKCFMLFVLITMIFSGGLVPIYLLIKNLGLINNIWVYILPLLTNAFNILVVKNFFQSIPESIAESARIDGASELRILFQFYMPLSKPILTTVALWTAVIHWNMWFDAMIFVYDNKLQVLQTFLQRIVIQGQTSLIEKGAINYDIAQYTSETLKAAVTVVTIVPILLVYPFLQKYFIKGIMIGSVKE
ncbi:MAG: hypothetical protein A2007_05310 [Verrucomicrobia bacterium GWC2_42_7]|nr:MAG: hypothetical protein A2007_05310 [Verrucomicrobia bacterium GWC2_42_7]